jgi:hypothetical protein
MQLTIHFAMVQLHETVEIKTQEFGMEEINDMSFGRVSFKVISNQ